MFRRTAAAAFAALAPLLAVASACTSTDVESDAAETANTLTTESTTSGSADPPHLVDGPATPLEPGTYQISFSTDTGAETTPDALVDVPRGFED
jgi:hypothetical protein